MSSKGDFGGFKKGFLLDEKKDKDKSPEASKKPGQLSNRDQQLTFMGVDAKDYGGKKPSAQPEKKILDSSIASGRGEKTSESNTGITKLQKEAYNACNKISGDSTTISQTAEGVKTIKALVEHPQSSVLKQFKVDERSALLSHMADTLALARRYSSERNTTASNVLDNMSKEIHKNARNYVNILGNHIMLDGLRTVGEDKPLAHIGVEENAGSKKELVKIIQENNTKGLKTLIKKISNPSGNDNLFLHVYDEKALQKVLNENESTLKRYKWPTEARQFVNRQASEAIPSTPENQALLDILTKAYGDKPHQRDTEQRT